MDAKPGHHPFPLRWRSGGGRPGPTRRLLHGAVALSGPRHHPSKRRAGAALLASSSSSLSYRPSLGMFYVDQHPVHDDASSNLDFAQMQDFCGSPQGLSAIRGVSSARRSPHPGNTTPRMCALIPTYQAPGEAAASTDALVQSSRRRAATEIRSRLPMADPPHRFHRRVPEAGSFRVPEQGTESATECFLSNTRVLRGHQSTPT
jgi:hypothetical protein